MSDNVQNNLRKLAGRIVSRPGQRTSSSSSQPGGGTVYEPSGGRYERNKLRPNSLSSAVSNTSGLSRGSQVMHGSPESNLSYGSKGSALNSTMPSKWEESRDDIQLQKKVGLVSGVALIVGTMIGSGIFISPTGVALHSGSVGLTLVLWTIGGFVAMAGALSYAELGTFIAKSGAEYAYLLSCFAPMSVKIGALPAFLFNWVNMVLLKPAAVSIITLTFAIYTLEPFFQICEQPEGATKCLAALVICLITLINCLSVKASIWLQNILTVAKLLAIVVIIIGGFVKIGQGHTEQFSQPFVSPETSAGSIAIAMYTGMWAYDGWNNLNYVTEEIINPHKNLKWAIFIAIPLVTLCYVLVNISYFTVMTVNEIAESTAVAVTWGNRVLGVMSWMIPVFVACSTFGAANGTLFSAGRLSYSAAREGHMVEVASMIHVRHFTPLPSIIFTSIMALIFIIPGDIYSLIDFFSFAVWFFYGMTMVALVIMRFWGPEKDTYRPFRVPIFIPIGVALVSIFLVFVPIVDNPKWEYFYAFLFIMSGVIFYIPFVVFAEKVLYRTESFMVPITSFLQCLMEISLPTEETAAKVHETTI